MRVSPYARPQLTVCLVLSAGVALLVCWLAYWQRQPSWYWFNAVPALAVAGLLWFFRHPDRTPPRGSGLILAPADGVVTHVDTIPSISVGPDGVTPSDHPLLPGPAQRVSIFMSVFDVHVNRAPVSGKVLLKQYKRGGHMDVRRDEAHHKNERMDLVLEPSDPDLRREVDRLLVRQLAGLVARKIVCGAKPMARLEAGEAYGMIKFGSRLSVYVPAASRVEWRVSEGDRVKAGETVLGLAKAPLELPAFAVPTLAMKPSPSA